MLPFIIALVVTGLIVCIAFGLKGKQEKKDKIAAEKEAYKEKYGCYKKTEKGNDTG